MPVIIEAPPDRLRHLAELQRLQALRNASADNAFDLLGYEPICVPRVKRQKAIAAERGIEDEAVPKAELPPPCGLCPQELFHSATEFDVFYGGAAGGGKSAALVAEALRAAHRYPGIRIGIFRRSYPELEESVIAELARLQYGAALGGRWNPSKHDLIFPSRSLIMCRYAKSLPEATRRQGGQYQLLLVDERTLMVPGILTFLGSRLRSGRSDVPVIGVRSSGNPGGPGHAEMKARYVEATDHGARTYQDGSGRSVRFIPARLDDNPYLNPEYERDLEGLPPAMRKAFRDGDWDGFVGQVFEEWHHDRHVVARFALPPEWRRLVGIDWGYSAPWAVLWAAVDPDGRLYVYRELYGTKVGETTQARRILEAEGDAEHPARFADPSMWRSTGEGPTIASTYQREGVALMPANNERLAGWARVHHYLAEGPACLHHRNKGWETCPRLHVLDGCAPNLVRTLPALPYDRTRVEDVDTDAEDHAPDALRYLVMGAGAGSSSLWFPGAGPGSQTLDGRPPAQPIGGPPDNPTVVTPAANAGPRFVFGSRRL